MILQSRVLPMKMLTKYFDKYIDSWRKKRTEHEGKRLEHRQSVKLVELTSKFDNALIHM